MKRIVTAILTAAALLLPLSAAAAPADGAADPGQKFTVYENQAYNLKVQYPAKWELRPGADMVIVSFISPLEPGTDTFKENLNIVAEDLGGQSFTIEKYTKLNIDNMVASLGYNLAAIRDFRLSGLPAKAVEWTFTYKGYSIHMLQVYTIAIGRGYCITYTAEEDSYARYLPVAMRIIDSVVIK